MPIRITLDLHQGQEQPPKFWPLEDNEVEYVVTLDLLIYINLKKVNLRRVIQVLSYTNLIYYIYKEFGLNELESTID